MDPWMEAALAYIPSWLEFQMRQSQQPGCAVAIVQKGEVVLDLALGVADLRTSEVLTPRHRFRIGSHSKAFTAAGIMLLRERGCISLDDPIGQHMKGLYRPA